MSLLNEINNKLTHVDYKHIHSDTVFAEGDEVKIGKDVMYLTPASRAVLESYVGFGYKFKNNVPEFIRDKVINQVFESKDADMTFSFVGHDIGKIMSGHRRPVPVQDVVETVDKVVPKGELSLFSSNGFDLEFTVTTPEICDSPGYNYKDETRGGIYMKAMSSTAKPSLTVIPVLHRMFCANQMSQEQKDSALKITGDTFTETTYDLEKVVQSYLDNQVPNALNRWLGLTDVYPNSPKGFAKYLLNKAHVGKKITKDVLEDVGNMNLNGSVSAYEIVNVITEKQHDKKISDSQRTKLWNLGSISLESVDNKLVCTQCEHTL